MPDLTDRGRQHLLGLTQFIDGRDHREHQSKGMCTRHPQRRAQLIHQQVGAAQQLQTQTTNTQRGVCFWGLGERGQRLVSADIEGAQDHRPRRHRTHNLLEHDNLLRLGGQAVGAEKKKLAPQEADAVRAGSRGSMCVLQVGRIAPNVDAPPVLRDGGLGIGNQSRRSRNIGDGLRGWVDDQRPSVAVEQHRLSIDDGVHQPGDPNNRRQPQRPRQDRRMRGRGSLFGREAHDQRPIQSGGLRRREVASDHNRWRRRWRRHITHPMQGASELLDHILDVRGSRLEYLIV